MINTVTCICTVLPDRIELAQRAIYSWLDQQLGSHIRNVLCVCGNPDVLSVLAKSKVIEQCSTLSRYYSLCEFPDNATVHDWSILLDRFRTDAYSAFCFFDSDDQSHPLRLQRQINSYEERASFLTGGLLHFHKTAELAFFELERRFEQLTARVLLNTVLVRYADMFPLSELGPFKLPSPTASIGLQILNRCRKNNDVTRLVYEPWWIKIGVHSNNRQGYEKFRNLTVDRERAFTRFEVLGRNTYLRRFLEDYHWFDDQIYNQLDCTGDNIIGHTFNSTKVELNRWICPPLPVDENIQVITENVE